MNADDITTAACLALEAVATPEEQTKILGNHKTGAKVADIIDAAASDDFGVGWTDFYLEGNEAGMLRASLAEQVGGPPEARGLVALAAVAAALILGYRAGDTEGAMPADFEPLVERLAKLAAGAFCDLILARHVARNLAAGMGHEYEVRSPSGHVERFSPPGSPTSLRAAAVHALKGAGYPGAALGLEAEAPWALAHALAVAGHIATEGKPEAADAVCALWRALRPGIVPGFAAATVADPDAAESPGVNALARLRAAKRAREACSSDSEGFKVVHVGTRRLADPPDAQTISEAWENLQAATLAANRGSGRRFFTALIIGEPEFPMHLSIDGKPAEVDPERFVELAMMERVGDVYEARREARDLERAADELDRVAAEADSSSELAKIAGKRADDLRAQAAKLLGDLPTST